MEFLNLLSPVIFALVAFIGKDLVSNVRLLKNEVKDLTKQLHTLTLLEYRIKELERKINVK